MFKIIIRDNYDEVSKEVELLQRNKINVLGGILVE